MPATLCDACHLHGLRRYSPDNALVFSFDDKTQPRARGCKKGGQGKKLMPANTSSMPGAYIAARLHILPIQASQIIKPTFAPCCPIWTLYACTALHDCSIMMPVWGWIMCWEICVIALLAIVFVAGWICQICRVIWQWWKCLHCPYRAPGCQAETAITSMAVCQADRLRPRTAREIAELQNALDLLDDFDKKKDAP